MLGGLEGWRQGLRDLQAHIHPEHEGGGVYTVLYTPLQAVLDYHIRDKSLQKWSCLEQQREQVLPVGTWFQKETVGENGARLCESVIRKPFRKAE